MHDQKTQDAAGLRLWEAAERIGETWEWYPKAKRLADNSLKPGERREISFDPQPVAATAGNLSVEMVATNHRMAEANARAMGVLGRYPLSVETMRRRIKVVRTR